MSLFNTSTKKVSIMLLLSTAAVYQIYDGEDACAPGSLSLHPHSVSALKLSVFVHRDWDFLANITKNFEKIFAGEEAHAVEELDPDEEELDQELANMGRVAWVSMDPTTGIEKFYSPKYIDPPLITTPINVVRKIEDAYQAAKKSERYLAALSTFVNPGSTGTSIEGLGTFFGSTETIHQHYPVLDKQARVNFYISSMANGEPNEAYYQFTEAVAYGSGQGKRSVVRLAVSGEVGFHSTCVKYKVLDRNQWRWRIAQELPKGVKGVAYKNDEVVHIPKAMLYKTSYKE